MQIIQSLLGSQVNTLGQKSHLGYQHKISSQENSNAPRYRNNSFIKPLVLSKPIFTPSKFLLARKRQPLIDTLITDGYDLDILDMDTESSVTELEDFNSISEVNSPDKLIDIFDISKVSTILQAQIADEISNEILTETSIQQKAPTNKTPKPQTKKTPQSKSANKSKAKKSSKSSTPKRKTPIIDKASSIPNTTDNFPTVTDNTSAIQHINFHNPTTNIGETEIASVSLEDDLILPRKLTNDESQVITDLPSNSTDVFSASANGENEELLNQNSEIDLDISNLIRESTVETESTNSIANINRADNFTNQQQHLTNETTQKYLDISDSPNYSPAETESPNILQPNTGIKINEVLSALVSPNIEGRVLHHQNNPDEIIEEPSNTVLKTTQSASSLSDVNASNSGETISPKMENKANSFIQLGSNQDQPIVADDSYFATETEALNEVIASENPENPINTPQRLYIDNLTTEPVNTEAVELTSTSPIIDSQTNLFGTPGEVSESKQAITTSDITSVNQKYPIPKEATIQADSTSVTAPAIEETQSTELVEITPDSTSTVAPQSEEIATPLTNIQPEITSATAPEIEETQPTELVEITPVATSTVSPQSEKTATPLTNIQPEITSATAPEIEETQPTELTTITPVATSTVPPQSEEVATLELTNIQPKITSTTAPEIQEIQPTELAEIQAEFPTQDANIVKPDTADIPLANVTENLPIFPKITNNEQVIPSKSSLVFNNLDLSNFANTLDILEDTSSPNNVDIEPAAILNNLPAPKGYATGGQVTDTTAENHQPVAASDTVPAMLTPGEFVINAKDAERNLQILQHINTGGSPEEVISPSLEVTTVQKPETNSLPSTTKVDSFGETPLQRQSAETDTFPEPTPLSSPSLGVEVGKQRRSLLNHPHIDTMENTAHVSPSSPHYSSPSLIFRKTHSTTNTETPSQWSSVEELLNTNNDEFTNFNFGGVESNWQNYPSYQFASSSTPSQIFTKRLPTPQGFANGGEVIAPDISRDIAPITETIQSPYASSPTAENDDEDDGKLEALAQEIYYRLRQRIEIEKERQGIYVGRLPW